MDSKCRMGEQMYSVSEAPITAARIVYVGCADRIKRSKVRLNGKEKSNGPGWTKGREAGKEGASGGQE